MTEAQRASVELLKEWLNDHPGWVSQFEVFGRGNRATAHRRNIARAWESGELAAHGIAFVCGAAKLCHQKDVEHEEREFYFNDPSLSEGVRQMRKQHGCPRPETRPAPPTTCAEPNK